MIRKARFKKFICIILFFIFPTFSTGENKKKDLKWYQEKRIAFLVGINDYKNTSKLHYAVGDVNKLEQLLLQIGHFSKIVKLTDQGKVVTTRDSPVGARHVLPLRPTKENIEKTYMELLAEKPDLLVFYFSGHGFISGEKGGQNSIAPIDVRLKPGKSGKTEAENGIPLMELSRTDKPEYEKVNLVYLIDACRSPLPKASPKKKKKPSHAPTKNPTPNDQQPSTNTQPPNTQPPNTKSAVIDTMDELSGEIDDAKGVVMLLGAAPNASAYEDKDMKSGVFSYFLRKAISGGILNERAEEYVTVNSLKEYIEEKFEQYHKDEPRRSKQKLYHLTNYRGFSGDFLLTYGRLTENDLRVEKNLYHDVHEQRNVRSKLILDKDNNRTLLRFFAKNKKGKYYPESLEGIASMKYEFYPNRQGSDNYYGGEFNLEGENVFEHKMELLPDKGWAYKGVYKQTEEDKKDEERQKIYFEEKIYDFMGNVLFQEYFDRKGKPVILGGVKTVQRAYDSHGQMTLEEFLDKDGKLHAPEGQKHARYAAVYVSEGNLLSEAWYGEDGKLIENKNGIARIDYAYDRDWKLTTIENWNKAGKLTADKTGVAKTVFTYNGTCLETKKERLEKKVAFKFKEKAIKAWKLRGYKVCTETVVHTDKDDKPSSDAKHVHKKKFTFDEKGNKTIEEYYRADGRRWTRYGVAKKTHEYDKDGNITKTSNYSAYEVEGKLFPVPDEFGVHAYTYSYDFNKKDCLKTRQKQGELYKEYDCADTIRHLGIDGKPIENTEGVTRVKIWYDGTRQKEALREYYGMEKRYVRSNKSDSIEIYDSNLNKTLWAFYELKDGKETLDYKHVYEYDEKGNETLGVKYIFYNGKETLDHKYILKYDENGNKTLDASYKLKDGKETLVYKEVWEYDEKGNKTLNARYESKDGKEILIEKFKNQYDEKGNVTSSKYFTLQDGRETFQWRNMFKYNENGRQTLWKLYKLKNGKETVQKKMVYEYDEKGNITLDTFYLVKDGKETLSSKSVYKYDENGNKTLDASYTVKNDKETLASKRVYKYNEKGKLTLDASYTVKDGKETLNFKHVFQYDENGNKILDAKYILKNNKETLSLKRVFQYDEKGKLILDVIYTVLDGKETLSVKHVFQYDEKGNQTLSAYYTTKDGKETIDPNLGKSVFQYDENGNRTLDAYYTVKDGKETLDYKRVYKYDENGNRTLDAYYTVKDGKEILRYKYVYKYHETFTEIQEYYKKLFDNINKELDPKAELNKKDSIESKKDTAYDLAKEQKKTKVLKEIDDAWKVYRAKKKKYTLNYESFNEDGTFKEQEYKLLFMNPRGSFEDRLIRVDLDRFYRPVGVKFVEK